MNGPPLDRGGQDGIGLIEAHSDKIGRKVRAVVVEAAGGNHADHLGLGRQTAGQRLTETRELEKGLPLTILDQTEEALAITARFDLHGLGEAGEIGVYPSP